MSDDQKFRIGQILEHAFCDCLDVLGYEPGDDTPQFKAAIVAEMQEFIAAGCQSKAPA